MVDFRGDGDWNAWLTDFVARAQLAAAQSGHEVVDGRHLLLAATHDELGAAPVLQAAGVDVGRLRTLTACVGPPPTRAPGADAASLALAADAKGVVAVASHEADAAGQDLGPAHLLVGLAKVHVAFGSFGVFTNDIRRTARLPVPDPAPTPVLVHRPPLRVGRLVIDGGGGTAERAGAVLDLVRSCGPSPTVAFVGAAFPWAGRPHALQQAVEKAGGHLLDVGSSGGEDAFEIVARADVVHLAGGYPRYLVDYLAGAIGEALVRASDAGAVVWGASAGAIALGTGGVDVSGDDGPTMYPGLGWIDAKIVPHYQGNWDRVEADLGAGSTGSPPLLVVPHEGAVVAEPGWKEFNPLAPFPSEIGAWWCAAHKQRHRIA